jgi:alanine racemase
MIDGNAVVKAVASIDEAIQLISMLIKINVRFLSVSFTCFSIFCVFTPPQI